MDAGLDGRVWGELNGEELHEYRSCGGSKGAMIDLTTPTVPEPLPLPKSVDVDPVDKQHTIDALKWATGVRDPDMLNVVHATLPDTVLREQEHKHKESIGMRGVCAVVLHSAVADGHPTKKLTLSHSVVMKDRIAESFNDYLIGRGLDPEERLPRNCLSHFINENAWFPRPSAHQLKSCGTCIEHGLLALKAG